MVFSLHLCLADSNGDGERSLYNPMESIKIKGRTNPKKV